MVNKGMVGVQADAGQPTLEMRIMDWSMAPRALQFGYWYLEVRFYCQ
jgi:hypothetical protein